MPSRAISSASPFYVVMLGLLSALPPFGTDAGLPGLPDLQADLGVDIARATQTLTLFLLGFSIGPVLFGPLSDRYGRKPILLFGVAAFTVAAFVSSQARSIEILLLVRFLGGIGAGAASSLPAAIVRDVFHGEQALSRQSYVALVNAVAPLVAPLLGAAVLAIAGWRAIHASLAGLGVVLFLMAAVGYAETAPKARTASAISNYRVVIADRGYLLATALLATTFGTMFAYITGSSAVFMNILGASPTLYGILFACTAAGTIAGAASNARLSARWGSRRVLRGAVAANVAVSVLLLALGFSNLQSIPLTAALVVASNSCAGIIMPSATHEGLRELGHVAGSAAALQRGVQMIVGSMAGALVGWIGGPSLRAMAIVMGLCAMLSVVFLTEFHRRSYRGASRPV